MAELRHTQLFLEEVPRNPLEVGVVADVLGPLADTFGTTFALLSIVERRRGCETRATQVTD
jgi:rRNA processing protein Gar1